MKINGAGLLVVVALVVFFALVFTGHLHPTTCAKGKWFC